MADTTDTKTTPPAAAPAAAATAPDPSDTPDDTTQTNNTPQQQPKKDDQNPIMAFIMMIISALFGGGDKDKGSDAPPSAPSAPAGGTAPGAGQAPVAMVHNGSKIDLGPMKNVIAVGDSIAAGVNPVDGQTKVGASVNTVNTEVANLAPDAVKGANIVLSSGLSNSWKSGPVQQQLNTINSEIALLKQEGAQSVTLVGVSDKMQGLTELNANLKAIAQQNHIAYAPIETGADGIHPKSYDALKNSIIQANEVLASSGPASTPAVAGADGKARGQG